MNCPSIKEKLFFSACTILLLSLVLYLPLHNHKTFNSPDENSNYLYTKLYVDTGNLWYTEEYTSFDYENYLHPRHFVTYNNRIVPTQYLGLPIIYGPLYSIVGDNAVIIWAGILTLISFIFFVKLASLLFGESSSKYAALLFIANTPLLYFMSQSYYNICAGITFFISGAYYLTKYFRFTSYKDFFLASLLFSISIFFRYEFALFIAPLLIITLINKYKTKFQEYLKPLIFCIIVIVFFAIMPVLALNYKIYGNPLTYGIPLLEVYSIGRESTGFWQIFFPNPVILSVISANIYRLIFSLLPLVTMLFLLGITYIIKKRKFNIYMLLYGVLFVYLLAYGGSSDTYNAFNFSYLGFNTAILRYWLIPYIFLVLISVKGFLFIEKHYRILIPLLAASLIVVSISYLLIDNESSIIKMSHGLDDYQLTSEKIQSKIDSKSIIYLDTYDKILSPYGVQVATWWGQEEGYNPNKLTASMVRIKSKTEYSVYLYSRSPYVDINELNNILKKNNLFLEKNESIQSFYKLKKVQP